MGMIEVVQDAETVAKVNFPFLYKSVIYNVHVHVFIL